MNNRIKEVRKTANLTQADFGNIIGVSQNFVWMLETGQREPSDRTIRDICREFGVNEMWLREGIGEPYASKSREQELGEMFKVLLHDRPESFRSALMTTLLRFDPSSDQWRILEEIYNSVAAMYQPAEAEPGKDSENHAE